MNIFKVIIAIALMITVSATAPLHSSDGEKNTGIGFYSGSWTEALELAKKENKLIFLDLYATWCGPCKMLKSNTFPNPEVGEFFNSNFISLAFDAEKGEGLKIARKYNLTGYPTLLFVNGDGQLVARTMGYHSPEQLIQVGEQVISR